MPSPVKLATLLDVAHMTRIVQETFETPWSMQMLRATVLNHAYDARVIRKPAGGLVGFFISHTVQTDSNLDIVAVEAALRCKGIGTHLLETWIQSARLRNLHGLTLQVNTHNVRAKALYEGLAFRTARLLHDYYPNGDDAYEMRRPVGAEVDQPPLPRGPAQRPTQEPVTQPAPEVPPRPRPNGR
ncbi:MAG: GNAT family N-acetyltransferase [Candidatus Lambdaproteobacteria bacterium]|nr:GNAT family N-acetyltransferase [Candidatus Lambdaproteobacteria bacterium]